jgi:hypothetical protein
MEGSNWKLNGHRYDCFEIYALVHIIVMFYGIHVGANLLFKFLSYSKYEVRFANLLISIKWLL